LIQKHDHILCFSGAGLKIEAVVIGRHGGSELDIAAHGPFGGACEILGGDYKGLFPSALVLQDFAELGILLNGEKRLIHAVQSSFPRIIFKIDRNGLGFGLCGYVGESKHGYGHHEGQEKRE
jgi:hypothetical protein